MRPISAILSPPPPPQPPHVKKEIAGPRRDPITAMSQEQPLIDVSKAAAPTNHARKTIMERVDKKHETGIIHPQVIDSSRRRAHKERRTAQETESPPGQQQQQQQLNILRPTRREVKVDWQDEQKLRGKTDTTQHDHRTEESESARAEKKPQASLPPADHGILLKSLDFAILPIINTWFALHFFYMEEAPWLLIQQDALKAPPPCATEASSLNIVYLQDLDRIEAQSGPPPLVTNRKAKTCWSRGATMNGATTILVTLFVGVVFCGVGCTYHTYCHRAATTQPPHHSMSMLPHIRRPPPICDASAQTVAPLTDLFVTAQNAATANQTVPGSARLTWLIAFAKASLSRPAQATSITFHQAVMRIEQAETLLLPIDLAILLDADPATGNVDENFTSHDELALTQGDGDLGTLLHMDSAGAFKTALHAGSKQAMDSAMHVAGEERVNTALHAGGGKNPDAALLAKDGQELHRASLVKGEGDLDSADHSARLKAAVASHLDAYGSTCLRLALDSTRRLRTELLGIQPMPVTE